MPNDCIPGNIPQQIKGLNQWVNWGAEAANPKIPYNPVTLDRAKAGDPSTWGTFGQAVKRVEEGRARGIGFELNNNGFYVVDLDRVINEAGELTPEAAAVVNELNSYTERSLSGTGLHIFVYAPFFTQERERKKDSFVEIYGKAHYIAMTGDIYGGLSVIKERTAELHKPSMTDTWPTVPWTCGSGRRLNRITIPIISSLKSAWKRTTR